MLRQGIRFNATIRGIFPVEWTEHFVKAQSPILSDCHRGTLWIAESGPAL